jgi:Mrp family chromosome partitioning ATPase
MAGPIPPNPAELLARDSFGQVMAILKKTYDYVILDTAPVGLVTDTQSIGRYADMTVFVCRAAYTPGYAIAQLNQLSLENRLPNTCFILNGLSLDKK